jgi:hypothetical protein
MVLGGGYFATLEADPTQVSRARVCLPTKRTHVYELVVDHGDRTHLGVSRNVHSG